MKKNSRRLFCVEALRHFKKSTFSGVSHFSGSLNLISVGKYFTGVVRKIPLPDCLTAFITQLNTLFFMFLVLLRYQSLPVGKVVVPHGGGFDVVGSNNSSNVST